jgi:hypothetical protein
MLRGQRPRVIFVVAPRGTAIARCVRQELALYRAHGGLPVVIGDEDVPAALGDTDAAFARGREVATRTLAALA